MIIGAAVSSRAIIAALPDGTLWTQLLVPAFEADSPAALRSALRALRERVARNRAVLRIALLPPLVQGRRLELPRLAPDEYRHVLARDAARHFVTDGAPQVAAPLVLRQGPRALVFVALAPVALIESVLAAAREAGWKRAALVPAYLAWASGAATPVLVLATEGETTVLGAEQGRPTWIRRLPPDADDEAVVRALRDAATGDELPNFTRIEDPAALAARGARVVSEPELLPESRHVERRARARRVTLRLVAAAFALLVADAGLRLWDVRRELAAIRVQRAEIRAAVGDALAARDSLAGLEEQVARLAQLEATSPRWTGVLATLADALPPDAYVLTLRATGDTVVVGGLARQATGVLAGLQDAGAFRTVRAEAPIRRELVNGETAVERFTVSVRVASEGTP